MELEQLLPVDKPRVLDLLESIGYNTSAWYNGGGGRKNAASNPGYCFEWCFEDGEIIVLNLWYQNLEMFDGKVVQRLNSRETAEQSENAARKRRATRMDSCIRKASQRSLPIRVIINHCHSPLDGQQADKRALDEIPWHVDHYDQDTGRCRLVRGAAQTRYIDQFSIDEIPEQGSGARIETITGAYSRCPKIRAFVLSRAAGHCEYCGERGFETSSGSIFLETHHIEPLSQGGDDSVDNVVALCPNDHRKAHHARDREEMKEDMINWLQAVRRTSNAA